MAAFSNDCPHCSTKGASFEVLDEYRLPLSSRQIAAFVSCGVCGDAAVAVFVDKREGARNLKSDYPGNPSSFGLLYFRPRPETPDAPPHLPNNVRTYYLEAVENVRSGPNAAGAMFRKALDVGLRHVAPEANGRLVGRIDSAAKAGKITPDLAEWAHHIRLEGNDASHDEDPFTREEAKDLHRFTELVMMYFFSLPGMLKERRAKKEEDAKSGIRDVTS